MVAWLPLELWLKVLWWLPPLAFRVGEALDNEVPEADPHLVALRQAAATEQARMTVTELYDAASTKTGPEKEDVKGAFESLLGAPAAMAKKGDDLVMH